MAKLSKIIARSVFDGGGDRVPEIEIAWSDGVIGRSCFAGGISVGPYETPIDGGPPPTLKHVGVMKRFSAWANDRLEDLDTEDQCAFDARLEADDFSAWVGRNGCVALSTAFAKGMAQRRGLSLHQSLSQGRPARFPIPTVTIIGGGSHAGGIMPVQETMIAPVRAATYVEALEWCKQVFDATKMRLSREGLFFGTTIEGGIWPPYGSVERGFDLVCKAISDVGLEAGADILLSLDIAAHDLRDSEGYDLGEQIGHMRVDEYYDLVSMWISDYPIGFVEDPFAPQDGTMTQRLLARFGERVRIIADDPVASDPKRMQAVGDRREFNGVLIKPTHCGSLTALGAAVEAALKFNLVPALGGRSRETEENCLIHLAIAYGIPLMKIGGFSGVDRFSHWNEGLRLVEGLGHARLVGANDVVAPLR